MFERKNFFRAGLIKKTFGVKGELILVFDKKPHVVFTEKEPIFPEINGKLVPFFIEALHWQNPSELRLKLEDIHTKEQAATLTGLSFFLERPQLPKTDEPDVSMLRGYEVIDEENGKLGIIREIIFQKVQDILLIENHGQEYMIPVAEEFIVSVDHEHQRIITRLPEGLVKIND
jgi:16S rRNA processing protein RimM